MKATSELAFKARQLRRAGKLAETFTLDGKVFVKTFSTGSLTLIKNDGHLRQVADLSPYSEIAVRPLFNGPHLSQQTPGELPSETRPQVNATSDPLRSRVPRATRVSLTWILTYQHPTWLSMPLWLTMTKPQARHTNPLVRIRVQTVCLRRSM